MEKKAIIFTYGYVLDKANWKHVQVISFWENVKKTKTLRSIDDVKMDVLYETKDMEIMKKALGYLDEAFKLRKLKSEI